MRATRSCLGGGTSFCAVSSASLREIRTYVRERSILVLSFRRRLLMILQIESRKSRKQQQQL